MADSFNSIPIPGPSGTVRQPSFQSKCGFYNLIFRRTVLTQGIFLNRKVWYGCRQLDTGRRTDRTQRIMGHHHNSPGFCQGCNLLACVIPPHRHTSGRMYWHALRERSIPNSSKVCSLSPVATGICILSATFSISSKLSGLTGSSKKHGSGLFYFPSQRNCFRYI